MNELRRMRMVPSVQKQRIEQDIGEKTGGYEIAPVISAGVTQIESYAYAGRSELRRLQLPEGLIEIGEGAFDGCTGLEELVLPQSLRRIGKDAFFQCRSLQLLRLPEHCEYIGARAFGCCTSLRSMTIPDGDPVVEKDAFEGCFSLTELIVPPHARTLQPWLRAGCTVLDTLKLSDGRLDCFTTGSLPDGMTIENVTTEDPLRVGRLLRQAAVQTFVRQLPDVGTERYGRHCGYIGKHTDRLMEPAMRDPELMALICREGLLSAEALESYLETSISQMRTEITALLLEYKRNRITERDLERLEKRRDRREEKLWQKRRALSDSPELSGKRVAAAGLLYSFPNREELKRLLEMNGAVAAQRLSAGVDILILGCTEEREALQAQAEALEIEVMTERGFRTAFGLDIELKGTVLKRYLGVAEQLTVPDGVTEIGEEAFMFCDTLRSIILPDSVVSIARGAFRACKALERVCFPKHLREIGEGTFAGCSLLTDPELPEGLQKIGREAFRACSSIESIRVPSGPELLPGMVFSDCSSLREVVLSDGIKRIGTAAFRNCRMLEEIRLPEDLKTIDGNAFVNCHSLQRIDIPASVAWIDAYTFSGCEQLETVHLQARTTEYHTEAFRHCPKLHLRKR